MYSALVDRHSQSLAPRCSGRSRPTGPLEEALFGIPGTEGACVRGCEDGESIGNRSDESGSTLHSLLMGSGGVGASVRTGNHFKL